jgi:hypothetical protein
LAVYAAGAGQYNPAQNGVGVTVTPHPELSLFSQARRSVQAHERQVSDPELVASQWRDRAALSSGRCVYCGGTLAVEGWGALHSASGDRLVHSPSLYSTAWACACCAVGPAYSTALVARCHLRASPLGSAFGANFSVSSASPVLCLDRGCLGRPRRAEKGAKAKRVSPAPKP